MYRKWINTLKQVKLFEGIEDDALESTLSCLAPKIATYYKKEYITIANNSFESIGIILLGEVSVTRDNALGDRIIISKLKEHDLFGDVLAFSKQDKWESSIIANTDCTILFIKPDVIVNPCSKFCIGHKLLIQNMLKIVSEKAFELNKNIEYLSMKSIRRKIGTYLLNEYKREDKTKFNIELNRNELAEYLNVSRPSLSRELVNMQDEGMISFKKAQFEILDLHSLKYTLVN